MTPAGSTWTWAALGLALLCGGCSADSSTLKALAGDGSALKIPTNALASDPAPVITSADPPIDIYARVARGALKCWFGSEGSLKKTHVFHAKADSPTAGTPIEIAVNTREEGTSHGVLRAFAVLITPSGSGSLVESRNVRFVSPQAEQMVADVARWTEGKDDCSVVGTGGWNAAAPRAEGAAATPAPGAGTPSAAPVKAKP